MAKKDSSVRSQENDRANESQAPVEETGRLRSESHDSGLGEKRISESRLASRELEKNGVIPKLSIDCNASGDQGSTTKTDNTVTKRDECNHDPQQSKRKGETVKLDSRSEIKKGERNEADSNPREGKEALNGASPSAILNDPKACFEDKIKAAKKMADSGQNEFQGADGRRYSVQTKDYGRRTGTVLSTSDTNGNFMPVLRGLVDKQGNVTHQQYTDGHEAGYAGDRAQKELRNSNVLGTNSSNAKRETGNHSDGRKPNDKNNQESHEDGSLEQNSRSDRGIGSDKSRDLSNENGKSLARLADQMASRINTVGDCAKGPRKTFEQLGFQLQPAIATKQGIMIEGSGLFREVPLAVARPGDYGYRHWNSQVSRAHGGVDKGDSFIVTGRDSHGNLLAANDHKFVVPPDGGRYQGLRILRPTEEFFKRYPVT